MKKLFTFIVGAVVGLGAYAQDFDSGDLRYSVLSPDDKTCAVTGHYDLGSVVDIPETVTDGEEWYTVTEVGDYAFGWVSFESLTLPSSLESLGSGAFVNNGSLREVVIPNSVKEIGSECFAYCWNLKKVVLGSSVEVINSRAFADSPVNTVEPLGDTPARFEYGFLNTFTANPFVAVSEEVVAAYQAAWDGANVVPNIPAESLVFDPGSYMVQPGGTVQLTWVVEPANAPVRFSSWNTSVVTVDENGLVTADKLRGGYGVTVEATSLNGMSATCYIETERLDEFEENGFVFAVIPDTENEVALMRYVSNDAVVNIPETAEYNGNIYSVTTVGPNVFAWNGDIQEVFIPASVKFIKETNFYSCSSLKKVTIEDSTTPLELSNNNFNDDSNLAEVYVGRSLIRPEGATCFGWNIEMLSRIVLGEKVTSLSSYLFQGCSNLSLVESQNPEPPTIGENTFANYNPTIIVPAGSEEAYQEAWSQYASGITVAVDAENIYFETDEVTLYNGQNVKLPLIVEPEGATVVWTSSNPNIAYVDKDGNVSYGRWTEQVGEAVITASTLNGMSATCNVISKHWLTFSADELTLNPEDTYTVSVEKPEVLDNATINWSTNNESVATVDENGVITAVAPGDADIFAYVDNVPVSEDQTEWFEYRIQVNVRTAVESVTAEESVISIWQGNEAQIRLIFEPNDEYVNREMTWTVANPEIAEVEPELRWDGYYYVRGLKAGNTTITGETTNGKTVEIEVSVKEWPYGGITFPNELLRLTVGDDPVKIEFTTDPEFTNLTYSYRSSDDAVATVDEEGMITAVGGGYAEIYVEADTPWGYRDWIGYQRVEVRELPTAVYVEESDITVWKDNSSEIYLNFEPDNEYVNREMTWTVAEPAIASVNPSWDGRYIYVQGLEVGNTTITGTTVNGLTVNIDVAVKTQAEQIIFAKDVIYLSPDESTKLEFETVPEFTNMDFTYTSENDEVATVDNEGIITAHSIGSTYINVFGEGDWLRDIRVVVDNLPESVTLEDDYINVVNGSYKDLNLVFNPEGEDVNMEMTWTIDNPEIAEFQPRWNYETWQIIGYQVRGKSLGTTTFTGTTLNGLTVGGTISVEGLNIYYGSKDASDMSFTLGETVQLEIEANPEDIRNTIQWSYDENIITVASDGSVTGVAPGECWLTASYELDGSWYSDDIWVVVCPLSGNISLSSTQEIMRPGYSRGLWVRFPVDEQYDITWETSDPNVVEIYYTNGDYQQIRYEGVGTATIKATASNGATATCEVICVNPSINKNFVEMRIDQTDQLEVLGVPEDPNISITWWTDDWYGNVVKVTEDGEIASVGYGDAYVYADIKFNGNYIDRVYAYIRVVEVPVEGVTLSAEKWTIYEGDSFQLTATISPEDADDATLFWTSDNEEVATVDENGYVTAIMEGTAIITATAVSGKSASCEVTVISHDVPDLPIYVKSIELSVEDWSAKVGETLQLTADVTPSYSTARIYWTSSDESVVTVNYKGVMTAVGVGEAVVTAQVYDGSGVSAECHVTVTEGDSPVTGVDGVDSEETFDVYTQQGILIRHACTAADLKELQSGIYIIRSGNTVKTVYLRN